MAQEPGSKSNSAFWVPFIDELDSFSKPNTNTVVKFERLVLNSNIFKINNIVDLVNYLKYFSIWVPVHWCRFIIITNTRKINNNNNCEIIELYWQRHNSANIVLIYSNYFYLMPFKDYKNNTTIGTDLHKIIRIVKELDLYIYKPNPLKTDLIIRRDPSNSNKIEYLQKDKEEKHINNSFPIDYNFATITGVSKEYIELINKQTGSFSISFLSEIFEERRKNNNNSNNSSNNNSIKNNNNNNNLEL